MRFFLILLPIMLFFSFRGEQSHPKKVDVVQMEGVYAKPFKVYADPVNGILKLQSNVFRNEKTQLYIFNVSGNLVYKLDSVHFNSARFSEVNLNHLSAGLYFIQLRVNSYSVTKKILKS